MGSEMCIRDRAYMCVVLHIVIYRLSSAMRLLALHFSVFCLVTSCNRLIPAFRIVVVLGQMPSYGYGANLFVGPIYFSAFPDTHYSLCLPMQDSQAELPGWLITYQGVLHAQSCLPVLVLTQFNLE